MAHNSHFNHNFNILTNITPSRQCRYMYNLVGIQVLWASVKNDTADNLLLKDRKKKTN